MRKPVLTAVACIAGVMSTVPLVHGAESTKDVIKNVVAENTKGEKAGEEMPAKEMAKHFAEMAAQSNLFEIELGQYATEHVKDSDVKQFAEKLVADHQKAQSELVALGKSSDMEVPTALDELMQKKLEHIEKMHGKHFEKAFVYHNVADHMMCVLVFRDASQELKNKQLKEYAMKQLPVLREHLATAEKLANFDETSEQTTSDKVRSAAEKVRIPK